MKGFKILFSKKEKEKEQERYKMDIWIKQVMILIQYLICNPISDTLNGYKWKICNSYLTYLDSNTFIFASTFPYLNYSSSHTGKI